jgi:hypothetical protein
LAEKKEGGSWRGWSGGKEERARQQGRSAAAGREEPMLGCGDRLLAWDDLGQIPLAKPTAGLCRRQAVGIGRVIFLFFYYFFYYFICYFFLLFYFLIC